MYYDNYAAIQQLTMEERGRFMTAIFERGIRGEPTDDFSDNGMLKMLYCITEAQLERDEEKYQKQVERNTQNGKLGGRPPNNQS